MRAGFNNLFQKKWFSTLFIAMLILLIVETSVIIFLIVVSGLGSQVFPALDLNWYATPGCSALTARVVSSTIDNRTVEYSCSSGGAINIRSAFPHDFFSRYGPGPAVVLVVPTFSLPKGYLRLTIVDRRIGCMSNQVATTWRDRTHDGQFLLRSGQNMTLGEGFEDIYGAYGGWSYDYCSVIAGQTGRAEGFKISWKEIPWPTEFVKISASPAQLSVPEGGNASSTLTLTSLGYFSGNVTFGGNFESPGYYREPLMFGNGAVPSLAITPQPAFVPRGGSVNVRVTIIAYPGSAPQTLRLALRAYPGTGTADGYQNLTVDISISFSIV